MNDHYVYGLLHLILDGPKFATYPMRDDPTPNPEAPEALDDAASSAAVAY